MPHSTKLFSFLIVALLCSCGIVTDAPLTEDERAQEINAVFEMPEVYTRLKLEPEEIPAFLQRNTEYLADSAAIQAFYARRNHQFAWFVDDTLSQAALNFLSLVDAEDSTGLAATETHNALYALAMRIADRNDTVPLTKTFFTQMELALTGQFFRFADKRYGGLVQKDLHELDWYVPRRKKDFQQLIDSLAAGRMDLSLIEPVHPQYRLLKAELQRLHGLTWMDTLPRLDLGETRKVEPRDRHALVPLVRQRLIAFGDMPAMDGDTTLLDGATVAGLQRYQARHGLLDDGIIGKGVVEQLNVPLADRIRTLLVNMERLRWVPEERPADLLLVNIPEFRLHVYEADTLAWSMNVVVGATATRTVIFSDELTTIVFSPYWNIPRSIVRGEVLPAVKKNSNYLDNKGMEVVRGGVPVPSSSIDWSQYSGSVPFEIRQKPGAGNALGRVKFLFPNPFSIYFHDTPSKSLFGRESRAFSHGCIRLGEPERLANFLLRSDSSWTAEKVRKAMYSGKQQFVTLERPWPVLIGYFTAWVDDAGRLNFRRDVYGHDARLAAELFGLPPMKSDSTVVAQQ